MSEKERREIARWLDQMVLDHPLYKKLEQLVEERIESLLFEIVNDTTEETHLNAWRRGKVIGMRQIQKFPHELREQYITLEGTVQDTSET